MINRVRMVAKASPKVIATAIGFQSRVLSAVLKIIGRNPPIEVTDVKIIGRRRIAPAFMILSQRCTPRSRSRSIKSSNIRELLTTIPHRATTAINVFSENGRFKLMRPMVTPIKANGMVSIMIKGLI